MAISRVATGNARDREGEAKRHMGWVTIGSETDFPTGETIHELQGGVSSRFPCLPNAKRGLSFVDVTRPFHAEATVNFVATVSAIAANQTVKSGSNRGHRIFGFAENPNLDHVARFPIVGGFGKARRDYDTVLILVDDVAVHRIPPIHSAKAAMAIRAKNPRRQRGPWNLGGMRCFMSFECPLNEGARKEEHPCQRSATPK